MGLELVELVMEVEDVFEITIPSERAGEMQTVGDLYEIILEEMPDRSEDSRVCMSAATFYALRRAVCKHLPPNVRIRTKDCVHKTLPMQNRRLIWQKVGKELGMRIPALCLPRWIAVVIVLMLSSINIWVFVVSEGLGNMGMGVFNLGVILLVEALVLWFATTPLKIIPGTTSKTFREMTNEGVKRNYELLAQRYGPTNVHIWDTVQHVVARQLGVSMDKVTRDTHFYYDLKAG